MKFDLNDKDDTRVVESSPYAMDYPADVYKAPDRAGVYMFIDEEDEVIYIGKACGGRLRDEIKAKRNTNADRGTKNYRWFRTNSDEIAKDLETDWIEKYRPKNNIIGM